MDNKGSPEQSKDFKLDGDMTTPECPDEEVGNFCFLFDIVY